MSLVAVVLLVLLLSADPISSFSTTATSSVGGGLFSAAPPLFFAELLKRSSLKKQLIKAANDKDEALVISLVDELSALSPDKFPTKGLGGYGLESRESGSSSSKSAAAPLNGEWRLLFTNAKDAEAPARTEKAKKAGVKVVAEGVQITTGQRIDACKGECVNYIYAMGEKRPFDKLEITIQMTALSPTRVRLDFQRGRAQNENAPFAFLKDVSFTFPPAFVGDGLARLQGKDPTVEPPAYFDILYIDQQIRAHRTGEGKIFVQMRQ